MKNLISVAAILMLALFSHHPACADDTRYDPGKLADSQADVSCQQIALMSLHPTTALNMIAQTRPTIIGSTDPKGKKIIIVLYKYRVDGVFFGCTFYDYTRGRLKLAEFGHYSKKASDSVMTFVNMLY